MMNKPRRRRKSAHHPIQSNTDGIRIGLDDVLLEFLRSEKANTRIQIARRRKRLTAAAQFVANEKVVLPSGHIGIFLRITERGSAVILEEGRELLYSPLVLKKCDEI